MSQFLIACGNKPKFDVVDQADVVDLCKGDSFIKIAATSALRKCDLDSCWYVVDLKVKTTESLFSNALDEMANGTSFENTRLVRILKKIISYADDVVLWYGDYVTEIEVVENPFLFFESVKEQMQIGSAEVYIRYSAINKTDVRNYIRAWRGITY